MEYLGKYYPLRRVFWSDLEGSHQNPFPSWQMNPQSNICRQSIYSWMKPIVKDIYKISQVALGFLSNEFKTSPGFPQLHLFFFPVRSFLEIGRDKKLCCHLIFVLAIEFNGLSKSPVFDGPAKLPSPGRLTLGLKSPKHLM